MRHYPSLRKIYSEEIFHYVMRSVFQNNSIPYGECDTAGEKQHIDAILADLTKGGDTADKALLKKLGLESYMDEDISFRQHLEERIRAGSNKHMVVEVIAKVAGIIDQEGWEAARADFPHLCADFETRILPRCYELCQKNGIKVPDTESTGASKRDSGKSSGWKR